MADNSKAEHLRVRGCWCRGSKRQHGTIRLQDITGKDSYQPSPIKRILCVNTLFCWKHGRLPYKKQSKLNCGSGIPRT